MSERPEEILERGERSYSLESRPCKGPGAGEADRRTYRGGERLDGPVAPGTGPGEKDAEREGPRTTRLDRRPGSPLSLEAAFAVGGAPALPRALKPKRRSRNGTHVPTPQPEAREQARLSREDEDESGEEDPQSQAPEGKGQARGEDRIQILRRLD